MPKFSAPNPPMIPARFHGGSQTPKVIVIHGTVSHDDAGTARNIAEWWHGPTSPQTSAHYIVDPAEVIQAVGDHTVAYHCGHNQDSIGIELCDEQVGPASRWQDADSTAILQHAATLVAQLCLAYDIPTVRIGPGDLIAGKRGICGHVDETNAFHQSTHTDPGADFPWQQFMGLVRAAAKDLTAPTEKTARKHHATKTAAPGPLAESIDATASKGLATHPKNGPKRRFFQAVRDLYRNLNQKG